MEENLKRLYFKSDKSKILEIMHHLNPKYLIGLWRDAISKERNIYFYHIYYYNKRKDWGKKDELWVNVKVPVKYDGYIFYASVKTIKAELERRYGKEIDRIRTRNTKGEIVVHCIDIPNPKKDKKTLNKYDNIRKTKNKMGKF